MMSEKTAVTVITTKGQVVIPSRIRKEMDIKPGTRLVVIRKNGEIILKPIGKEFLESIAGTLKTGGKLARKLLRDRRKDRRRE